MLILEECACSSQLLAVLIRYTEVTSTAWFSVLQVQLSAKLVQLQWQWQEKLVPTCSRCRLRQGAWRNAELLSFLRVYLIRVLLQLASACPQRPELNDKRDDFCLSVAVHCWHCNCFGNRRVLASRSSTYSQPVKFCLLGFRHGSAASLLCPS